MLVGTPVPCEPCPSHSNFEGPLHPPFPLAFSALTLPDCPADPDKHIGISDHVWIWSDTREKKKCLASSSLDLKCAEFNPCRSDVEANDCSSTSWIYIQVTSAIADARAAESTAVFGVVAAVMSLWSFRSSWTTESEKKSLEAGENFFSEKTPRQNDRFQRVGIPENSPTKYEKENWKKNPQSFMTFGFQMLICRGVYAHDITWPRFLSQVWHFKKMRSSKTWKMLHDKMW